MKLEPVVAQLYWGYWENITTRSTPSLQTLAHFINHWPTNRLLNLHFTVTLRHTHRKSNNIYCLVSLTKQSTDLNFHFKYTDYSMYRNTWTLWNPQAGISIIHGMVLTNIFLITASDEGQYQLMYPFWDWFPDRSCLLSLYWSASQLEDSKNSVCICATDNHSNVI